VSGREGGMEGERKGVMTGGRERGGGGENGRGGGREIARDARGREQRGLCAQVSEHHYSSRGNVHDQIPQPDIDIYPHINGVCIPGALSGIWPTGSSSTTSTSLPCKSGWVSWRARPRTAHADNAHMHVHS